MSLSAPAPDALPAAGMLLFHESLGLAQAAGTALVLAASFRQAGTNERTLPAKN